MKNNITIVLTQRDIISKNAQNWNDKISSGESCSHIDTTNISQIRMVTIFLRLYFTVIFAGCKQTCPFLHETSFIHTSSSFVCATRCWYKVFSVTSSFSPVLVLSFSLSVFILSSEVRSRLSCVDGCVYPGNLLSQTHYKTKTGTVTDINPWANHRPAQPSSSTTIDINKWI